MSEDKPKKAIWDPKKEPDAGKFGEALRISVPNFLTKGKTSPKKPIENTPVPAPPKPVEAPPVDSSDPILSPKPVPPPPSPVPPPESDNSEPILGKDIPEHVEGVPRPIRREGSENKNEVNKNKEKALEELRIFVVALAAATMLGGSVFFGINKGAREKFWSAVEWIFSPSQKNKNDTTPNIVVSKNIDAILKEIEAKLPANINSISSLNTLNPFELCSFQKEWLLTQRENLNLVFTYIQVKNGGNWNRDLKRSASHMLAVLNDMKSRANLVTGFMLSVAPNSEESILKGIGSALNKKEDEQTKTKKRQDPNCGTIFYTLVGLAEKNPNNAREIKAALQDFILGVAKELLTEPKASKEISRAFVEAVVAAFPNNKRVELNEMINRLFN